MPMSMRAMVALAAVSALCLAQAPVPNPRLSEDEIAIYRAYLETVAKNTIHLGNRTVEISGSRDRPCLKNAGVVLPEPGGAARVLDPELIKGMKIELVDPDKQKEILTAAKTPKAASEATLYTLSPIAFDKDRRHAALQYAIFCGPDCTNSAILIFEKVNTEWRWTGQFCGRLIA